MVTVYNTETGEWKPLDKKNFGPRWRREADGTLVKLDNPAVEEVDEVPFPFNEGYPANENQPDD